MFVTSPALMNLAVFSRPFGHRGCPAKTLQSLSLSVEALAIIADLGEQTRSKLGSCTRQRAKQIMIGVAGKECFDSLTLNCQLLINREEHLHQTQG